MQYIKTYSIKNNRFKKAGLNGCKIAEDDKIQCEENKVMHGIFLPPLDSAMDETMWGRLKFAIEIASSANVIVYAYASNEKKILHLGETVDLTALLCAEERSIMEKLNLLEYLQAERFSNRKDVLLYNEKGRYLWLAIIIKGKTNGWISDIQVTLPGDNFMKTFPEVYQDEGGFFHRYLSVFSSMYNDFQTEIEKIEERMDVDKADRNFLLAFAQWMGIDVSGDFLQDENLRKLVKNASSLNRMKGTKQALELLTDLIMGERAAIVERSAVQKYMHASEEKVYNHLYGETVYDITLLVRILMEKEKRSQFMFLLDQFMPVRARLNIVFLEENSNLNDYCYLDWNANLYQGKNGQLDQGKRIDDRIVLQ